MSDSSASLTILRETSFFVDDTLIKPSANEIIVRGEKHRVRQKVIDVLAYMAAKKGEVVSREEMLQQLWRTQPASDEVLTQVVSQLRKLLNSDVGPQSIIETIPKIGYRLIAEIRIQKIQPRSFGSRAPLITPTDDNFALIQWVEKMARQNRILWVAVVSLLIALTVSLIVLFQLGPYGEEIIIETIDGQTTLQQRRGFLKLGEEQGEQKDEN